ncbi:hypothetical protein ACFLYA_00930 [Candidatus Dependentiae bacterium]
MVIFQKIAKRLFISLIFALLIKSQAYAVDGMREQVERLSGVVSKYLENKAARGELHIPNLRQKVQAEAHALGWDMEFKCSQKDICSGKKYTLHGSHVLSQADVCKIVVKESNERSYTVSAKIDPNHDGCIKNSEDGNLHLAEALEEIFVKIGDNVTIGSARDFIMGNKNVYKVIQHPSLMQPYDGPCGYYALFNILKLLTGTVLPSQLLDRYSFEPLFYDWKQYNNGNIAVSNIAMKGLIENKIPELCKRNVMVSCEDVNAANRLHEKSVITFGGGSVEERIRDFQQNGIPQYLIVGTNERQNTGINGLNLLWSDIDNRLACTENHWLVIKIEWQNSCIPGRCPVIVTVMDSGGARDNRYATTIHWYYYLFAHSIVS